MSGEAGGSDPGDEGDLSYEALEAARLEVRRIAGLRPGLADNVPDGDFVSLRALARGGEARHVISAREAREALREFVLAYKGCYIDCGAWRASVEAEGRVMELAKRLIAEFNLA